MEKIGFYFDLIIRDTGYLLYLAIFLGTLVVVWMIWHKVKMRKARSEYLDVKQFEN
jgi:hypothetical protein